MEFLKGLPVIKSKKEIAVIQKYIKACEKKIDELNMQLAEEKDFTRKFELKDFKICVGDYIYILKRIYGGEV